MLYTMPEMVASSRTPEGTPNHCPVCKQPIRIEPSLPFGDAPCPNCGCLLWFVMSASSARYFRAEDAELVRKRLAEILGIEEEAIADFPRTLNEMGADSLDMVELVWNWRMSSINAYNDIFASDLLGAAHVDRS
jgi:acyl carrier protein